MESLKKNKFLLIFFGISLIAFLVYQFSGVFTSTDTTTEITQVDNTTSIEILRLLNQMQQAKIDTELFTSTAWMALVDYSVPLPNDPPGRPDLFGSSFSR